MIRPKEQLTNEGLVMPYHEHHQPTEQAKVAIIKAGGSIRESEKSTESWQYKGQIVFPEGTTRERYDEDSAGYGYYRYVLPTGVTLGYFSGWDSEAPSYSLLHVIS